MKLKPKNWTDFQHYNKRTPPWIKLHRGLLDDFDYQRLPIASKALAPMLWLIASEHEGGEFDGSMEFLAFRLRWDVKDMEAGLKPLIDKGFFVVSSGVLAERYQDATPETETETETDSCALSRTTSRFDEFWQAYPSKRDKKKARDKWKSKRLDAKADEIISDVKTRISKDRQWREGYIPLPTTYLNGERWEDELDSSPVEPNGPRARVLE